jgi:CRP-like cAMP-binding protein
MPTDELDLLRCPLFQDMTGDERSRVLQLLEKHRFRAGETLIEEGKETQLLWILVRGRCQVQKQMPHGGQQELATLEPGSVFGEISFFHAAPHSASVLSLTDVDVLQLSRERFEQLEKAGSRAASKIVRNLMQVLAERLRRMDEWTCRLIDHHADDTRRQEWHEFRSKLYSGWNFQ